MGARLLSEKQTETANPEPCFTDGLMDGLAGNQTGETRGGNGFVLCYNRTQPNKGDK